MGAYCVFDSDILALAVEGIPASYRALATAETYKKSASFLSPRAFQDFGLSDVYAALAPRPLLVLDPQDPLTWKMVEQEAAFAPVRAAHDRAKASPAPATRWPNGGRDLNPGSPMGGAALRNQSYKQA